MKILLFCIGVFIFVMSGIINADLSRKGLYFNKDTVSMMDKLMKQSIECRCGYYVFSSHDAMPIPRPMELIIRKQLMDQKPGQMPKSTAIWTPLGYFIIHGENYCWEGHGWISNQDREYYFIPELEIEEYMLKQHAFSYFLNEFPQFWDILKKSRSGKWALLKPQFADLLSVPGEKRKEMFSSLFSVLLMRKINH